jgi:hypothetical protein
MLQKRPKLHDEETKERITSKSGDVSSKREISSTHKGARLLTKAEIKRDLIKQ